MMDNKNANELIMLGTGNAFVTKCYNTCFVLRSGTTRLLVDAGGGNGVLAQLEKVGVSVDELSAMYLTHAHTDHVLGAVWIVRRVASGLARGAREGIFPIYGHERVLSVLRTICELTLSKKDRGWMEKGISFVEVKDKDRLTVGDIRMECFDILSTKEKQFGFRATLPDGTVVACLGDEPYNVANRGYVEGADWLMSEAFCLYRDREIFKPYEKHHSTAAEAGRLAAELGVKRLLLYHTEDQTLATRKRAYAEEAAASFTGEIFVPDDLERIRL